MRVKTYSVKEIIISQLYMFSLSSRWKERYNISRLNGDAKEELQRVFYEELEAVFSIQTTSAMEGEFVHEIEELKNILTPYSHQILFFAFNYRQLETLSKIISEIKKPVLILTNFEMPKTINISFSDTVTFLEINFIQVRVFQNSYLESKFPLMSSYLT